MTSDSTLEPTQVDSRQDSQHEAWPAVSVVVAARNAARTLSACLASLAALDYPRYEVIVANDGSSDNTGGIARAAGVRVIDTHGAGAAASRNAAVAIATGEVIAFTDSDCTVTPGWLRSLVGGLRGSHAAGAGGSQRNVFPEEESEAQALDTLFRAAALNAFFRIASWVTDYARREGKSRDVKSIPGCSAAYRRDVFVAMGGFRPGMFPGEDVDLDYRLQQCGYRLYYVPQAEVLHHRPGTLAWFAAWMHRYGRAQGELVRRYGRFRPLHYLPVVVGIVVGAQLLWVFTPTRWAAATIGGGLLVAAAGFLVGSAPPRLWPALMKYAVVGVVQWLRGYFSVR